MGFGQKLLAAVFAAVTPRTAGFAAVDMSLMSQSGLLLTFLLMLIGGSPADRRRHQNDHNVVLFASAMASVKHMRDTVIFKRKLWIIQSGSHALLLSYLSAVFVSALIIAAIEPVPVFAALFETASGLGTVGLSTDTRRSAPPRA